MINVQPIKITVFNNPVEWLQENLKDIHTDSISAVFPTTKWENLFNEKGFIKYHDEETGKSKDCDLQDHIKALQLLSEKVGVSLFVGGITSPLQLTDAGNWDIEVGDAFYQLVMLGEVVYG